MHSYTTSSDQRYPDSLTNTAIPQATAFWAPGGPASSQPAVIRDSDDRHGPPRIHANQLSSSAYPSPAAFSITQRDSYPAQTQSDCSGQYSYPTQHYIPTVNYAAPPFDLAGYPVSNDIHHAVTCDLPSTHRALRSFLVRAPITPGSIRTKPPPR